MKLSIKPNCKDLLFKFLKLKWQLEDLKELILKNIYDHIVDHDQISLQSFSEYTHLHHLPVDPQTLFHFLSEGGRIKGGKLLGRKIEEKEKECVEMERLRVIWERVGRRVDLLGREWLTEQEEE